MSNDAPINGFTASQFADFLKAFSNDIKEHEEEIKEMKENGVKSLITEASPFDIPIKKKLSRTERRALIRAEEKKLKKKK